MPDPREYVSGRQAARIMGVSMTRFDRIKHSLLIRTLSLPACPPRWHRADLEQLLTAAERRPEPALAG